MSLQILPQRWPLAPVQEIMLRAKHDPSLALQLVMDLKANRKAVEAAWAETVKNVAILQVGVVFDDDGNAIGLGFSSGGVGWETGRIDEEWLTEDRNRSFDWKEGRPWRFTWDDAGKACLSCHHALLDGASLVKVGRHFLERLSGGHPDALGLASWEEAEDEERAKAVALCEEMLAGTPQVTWDHGRGGACRVTKALPAEIVNRLTKVAEVERVTVATLVMWAYGQALAWEAGVEKVVIGQVRRGAPQEGKAGFTMNTLPVAVERGRDFRGLRARLMAWRDCEQVAATDLPGPTWSSVLMCDTGRIGERLGSFPELQSAQLHEGASEGLLGAAYIGEELDLEIDADAEIGAERANRLLTHWVSLLEGLVEGPGEQLERLPPAWEDLLERWEWGGAALTTHVDIGLAWREAVDKDPDRKVVEWPGGAWTMAELDQRARQLAGALQAAGLTRGDRFGAFYKDRRYFPEALLAAALSGTVYVPLDRRLPEERIRMKIEHAGTKGLLCESPEEAAVYGKAWIDPAAGTMMADEFGETGQGGLVALLFTSGSTGAPKAVRVEHEGLLIEAAAVQGLLGKVGKMAQFASPGFDASLEEMLVCLLHGGTLVSGPEVLAFEDYRQRVEDMGVEVLNLTTAYWAAWCAALHQAGEQLPSSVRAAVIGGEKLTTLALREWQAVGGTTRKLLNSYGPTEASVAATVQVCEGESTYSDSPPIGRPLAGYRIRVGDAKGRRLGPGVRGEIWIGGKAVSSGYWGDEEKTREAFSEFEGESWYRTGDRGWWDEQGRLNFGGREDDQLKIRGNRVEPDEVCAFLEDLPGVAGAFVAGHTLEKATVLAAWVKGEPDAELDFKELAEALKKQLPRAAVPTHWKAMESFPLTERGKVDRRALPEPEAPAGGEGGQPQGEAEQWLAGVWSEILGVEDIGRNDGFFELGGSSLQALKMFAKIASQWQRHLPLAQLLSTPDLKGLAAVIGRSDDVKTKLPPLTPLTPLQAGGEEPPLFCVHGGDGGTLFYRGLAECLPKRIPLTTIESPLLGAEEEPVVGSIEEIAMNYLAALRQQRPRGPYRLAGYSLGGVIVFEMARRLTAEGEEVSFLGMFDTANPAKIWKKRSPLGRVRVFWTSQDSASPGEKLKRLVIRTIDGMRTHIRVRREIARQAAAKETQPHSELRMLKLRELHDAAVLKYKPQSFAGKLALFKTSKPDEKFEVADDYGWGELVEKLEAVNINGEHLTIFEPEHVGLLAQRLEEKLSL